MRAAWAAFLGKRTYFAGAQGGRLVADWIASPLVSARDEFKADGVTLRTRAREMVRNDPTFARYVTLLADQVVGADGVCVEPRLYNRQGDLLKDDSRALGWAFQEWGRRESCTRDGRLGWAELLHTIVRLAPMDGEVFVQMLPGARNAWGLTLQLVDPDLVRHDLTQAPTRGNANEIVNGIELDTEGRPVRYHLWEDYRKLETVTVDAGWMLHLFWPRRPGDVRGITKFAPVMMTARMLHGYREAELIAARVAAAKMGVVTTDPEYGPQVIDPARPPGDPIPVEATPGSFWNAPAGTKVEMFDPTHPSDAFDPFVKSCKGDIAAGLGHSYVTLYSDWSATNYSSGKLPVLQERDHYRLWQQWLINGLCRPVYERWLQLATLKGAIRLPTSDLSQHRDAVYRPRTWPMFDPSVEVDIAERLLAQRLTTRTKLSANMGLGDWEDTLEQTQAEAELAATYDVSLPDAGASHASETALSGGQHGSQASAAA